MNNSQDVCAIILNSNRTEAEKKMCRNVQRLHRVEFGKMNVCRVLYIDASLSLKLIELTTNYTIALLQIISL
ncbi:hypothetical protein HF086_006402 [Spodoptera exigua]|uniref:Uncharacterized protein n=1 Tax=Spodoptera exigua TaxID=7107 RepID=A0A922SP18_SPOEX|nr:hypothetical protein HF086_006402 [Spodoptera exigua]